MTITLEAVEKVMNETGVEYRTAKAALEKTDGDAEAAILLIQPRTEEKAKNETVEKILAGIKEKVEEGNVSRIQISRKGEILLTVPVNVGIVGGLIGLTAAPWALIAAAVAAYGFDCKIEVIRKDGEKDEVVPEKKAPEEEKVKNEEYRVVIDDEDEE